MFFIRQLISQSKGLLIWSWLGEESFLCKFPIRPHWHGETEKGLADTQDSDEQYEAEQGYRKNPQLRNWFLRTCDAKIFQLGCLYERALKFETGY